MRNARCRASAFPVRPCAFPALRRELQWCACSAVPRKEGVLAVPRRAGNARGAACNINDRGGNDRRRMGILTKARDEPMRRITEVSGDGGRWQR